MGLLPVETLFYLLVGHAFADYVFQPQWMAEHKSPFATPKVGLGPWWWSMGAHGLINGGLVAFITGRLDLGLAELFVHSVMDTIKCVVLHDDPTHSTPITYVDQGVHLFSKVVWAWLA